MAPLAFAFAVGAGSDLAAHPAAHLAVQIAAHLATQIAASLERVLER